MNGWKLFLLLFIILLIPVVAWAEDDNYPFTKLQFCNTTELMTSMDCGNFTVELIQEDDNTYFLKNCGDFRIDYTKGAIATEEEVRGEGTPCGFYILDPNYPCYLEYRGWEMDDYLFVHFPENNKEKTDHTYRHSKTKDSKKIYSIDNLDMPFCGSIDFDGDGKLDKFIFRFINTNDGSHKRILYININDHIKLIPFNDVSWTISYWNICDINVDDLFKEIRIQVEEMDCFCSTYFYRYSNGEFLKLGTDGFSCGTINGQGGVIDYSFICEYLAVRSPYRCRYNEKLNEWDTVPQQFKYVGLTTETKPRNDPSYKFPIYCFQKETKIVTWINQEERIDVLAYDYIRTFKDHEEWENYYNSLRRSPDDGYLMDNNEWVLVRTEKGLVGWAPLCKLRAEAYLPRFP